jgi:hypothetical protein
MSDKIVVFKIEFRVKLELMNIKLIEISKAPTNETETMKNDNL